MTHTTYYVEGDTVMQDNGTSRFPALRIHENFPGNHDEFLAALVGILNTVPKLVEENLMLQMELEETQDLRSQAPNEQQRT